MAVWEEVVECVEVIVGVLEPTGDLECVGEAVCVLDIEAEAETVDVSKGVNVNAGVRVTEILVVDVLETDLEPVSVGELDCVFDNAGLNEFVRDWIPEFEIRELLE